MTSPRIISFGEVLWDLFPDDARFGGAPANFACHAAGLGGHVTMVSAVGNDDYGQRAIENLEAFGIDTDFIQVSPDSPTGTVGVETDSEGKPKYSIHDNSAWDELHWSPELEDHIATAEAVYFGTLGQRNETSRETIRQAASSATLSILDINLRSPYFDEALIRESIELADLLKLSDEELPVVAKACGIADSGNEESALRTILQQFDLRAVVVTRGAEGALYISPEETISQPGIPAEVVDTVGAGDSFTAALVLGLLRKEPIKQVLANACQTAADVCAHPGAIPN